MRDLRLGARRRVCGWALRTRDLRLGARRRVRGWARRSGCSLAAIVRIDARRTRLRDARRRPVAAKRLENFASGVVERRANSSRSSPNPEALARERLPLRRRGAAEDTAACVLVTPPTRTDTTRTRTVAVGSNGDERDLAREMDAAAPSAADAEEGEWVSVELRAAAAADETSPSRRVRATAFFATTDQRGAGGEGVLYAVLRRVGGVVRGEPRAKPRGGDAARRDRGRGGGSFHVDRHRGGRVRDDSRAEVRHGRDHRGCGARVARVVSRRGARLEVSGSTSRPRHRGSVSHALLRRGGGDRGHRRETRRWRGRASDDVRSGIRIRVVSYPRVDSSSSRGFLRRFSSRLRAFRAATRRRSTRSQTPPRRSARSSTNSRRWRPPPSW